MEDACMVSGPDRVNIVKPIMGIIHLYVVEQNCEYLRKLKGIPPGTEFSPITSTIKRIKQLAELLISGRPWVALSGPFIIGITGRMPIIDFS